MARVSIIKCKEYDIQALEKAIKDGLYDIGFDFGLFSGARVALKPNLMMNAPAEKAVATHPEFFRAAARVVKAHGGQPVLLESPGYMSLEKVARRVGHWRVCQEEGVGVADMTQAAQLAWDRARTFKRLEVAQSLWDVDVVMNLPKFKTHGLTHISGALKNLFGLVPGLKKAQIHMRAPNAPEFVDWLMDYYGALLNGFDPPKTFVHVMDAVVGQEGEGPGPAGTPRPIGVVICSRDAVAADFAAVQVTGLDKKNVLTITKAEERGLGAGSVETVEFCGAPLKEVKISGFQATAMTFPSHVLRGPIVGKTVRNWVMERPVPDPAACTLCFACKTICPAKAISRPPKSKKNRKAPKFHYRKCIRCFCCSEVCPEAAIHIRRGRLQWLLKT